MFFRLVVLYYYCHRIAIRNIANFDDLIKLRGYGLDQQSRSGDGLAKGSGNGTSDTVASADTNANNLNKN